MSSEQPYQIAISRDELVVLVKWHVSQAKKIPARMGAALMQEHATRHFFPSAKATRKIHDQARALMDLHANRAKGLASILKFSK